jgi:hypothetical protein
VAAVTATIVIAAIIAVVAFALTGNARTSSPTADPGPPRVAAAAATSAAPTASAGQPGARRTGPSATSAATSAAPTTPATTSPAAAAQTTASPAADPPSAAPTTASPAGLASAPTLTPTPGTLSEDPDGGTIVLELNGAPRQIDLTGSGRGDWHVSWSVAVANDPFNIITVSPAAGTLTSAGSTAAVTVRAHWFVPCGSPRAPTITVSPGGAVFSVCTGSPGHFSGGAGAFAHAADDAVYVRLPSPGPGESRAGPRGRPGVGRHHGRVL